MCISRHLHHLFHSIHISSHCIYSPDHYDCTDNTREDAEEGKGRITTIEERYFCITGRIHKNNYKLDEMDSKFFENNSKQEKYTNRKNSRDNESHPESIFLQKVGEYEEHRKCWEYIPEGIVGMIRYFFYRSFFDIHPDQCKDSDEWK